MFPRETTIHDIARELNVSASTVSRALKDHPAISPKTREVIKAKAHEMGYRSNALASGLRTRKSSTLGVIVPRLNSYFMSTVLAGMEKAAVEAGYHLIIMQSFEMEEKEKENIRLLFNHRVDGLMVSTTSPASDPDYFEPFFKKNIPVIFFDRTPNNQEKYNCVTIDNKRAGYQLTCHLLKNNRKKILHVTGNKKIEVYRQRLEGYKLALHEKNLAFDPTLVWETGLGVDDGKQIAEKILKMPALPDAIFVANDTCAIAIMHHLQAQGIKIPEKIQITGFNNDPFSAFAKPALTTVNYPGEIMGKVTANSLIHLINTKHVEERPFHHILDFELLIRESTMNQA